MKHWCITALVAAVIAAGCVPNVKNISNRPVKVDAALVKEMALPVYPNSEVVANASMRMSETIQSRQLDMLVITYKSSDALARVESWYDGKLPHAQRVLSWHFGSGGMSSFVVGRTESTKQVQLFGIGSGTQIQLVATTVASPAPSAGPTGR